MSPVISPMTIGEDHRTYKIDANDIAGAIAAVLSASKLIFMSDNSGITDAKGKTLREITLTQVNKMLNDDKKDTNINNKLRAALMAFEQNTEMVHIIDGKIPHALMLELFTDEIVGTRIKE